VAYVQDHRALLNSSSQLRYLPVELNSEVQNACGRRTKGDEPLAVMSETAVFFTGANKALPRAFLCSWPHAHNILGYNDNF
jgi:hypothetical protein